jgi:hypothetical protein
MIMSMNCDSCIWAHLSLDPQSKQGGQMLCKVNPPVPFAIPVPQPQGISVQVMNLWPTVTKNDGCSLYDDGKDEDHQIVQ